MESRDEKIPKKSHFCWMWKNQKFDLSFPSTSVYFSGLAGGLSLRARIPHLEGIWLVERFCRIVIPSPGRFAEVVANIVFGPGWCSMQNFSKSVSSFCPTVFFPYFSRMWLSIGGVKSPNKCVTPELSVDKLWCHGVTWQKKSKKMHFCWMWKIENFA